MDLLNILKPVDKNSEEESWEALPYLKKRPHTYYVIWSRFNLLVKLLLNSYVCCKLVYRTYDVATQSVGRCY